MKGFKIFNLDKLKDTAGKILLKDQLGRHTYIYTQIEKKLAGQQIIFYCKKLLIDSIDSDLEYYYKKPAILGNNEGEKMKNTIPFVSQSILRQKIYILPEGPEFLTIYTALSGEYSRRECTRIDVETISSLFEFTMKNSLLRFNYCYSSSIYLATPSEYIYTKVTTVAPYYIIVNQSSHSLIIE